MESQYLHRSKQSAKAFRYSCKYSKKMPKDQKRFSKNLRRNDYNKDYEEYSDESETDCGGLSEDDKILNEERSDLRQGAHLNYPYCDPEFSHGKPPTFVEKRSKSKIVDYTSLPFKILKKLRNHFGLSTTKKSQIVDAITQKISEKPSNDIDILKQFLLGINH